MREGGKINQPIAPVEGRLGPPITVVIPVFNAELFVMRTLCSVARQTLLPAEVVVFDDGSTDRTVEVVRSWAMDAPFSVRLMRNCKPSCGPSEPLNRAIDSVKTELVATLDHDDEMYTDRLQRQVAAVHACDGAGIVLGQVVGSTESGSRRRIAELGWNALTSLPRLKVAPGVFRIRATDAYRGLLEHGCYALTCSAFLFPRSVWARVGGFDVSIRTACDFAFLRDVTREYDLAYVEAPVVAWAEGDETLFQAAGAARRYRENWRILRAFRTTEFPVDLTGEWHSAARRFLFDAGYELRRVGRYRDAARFHSWLALGGGALWRAAGEFLKTGFSALVPTRRRPPP